VLRRRNPSLSEFVIGANLLVFFASSFPVKAAAKMLVTIISSDVEWKLHCFKAILELLSRERCE
jgi:hypothetical protein